jgi:hypothetical protein
MIGDPAAGIQPDVIARAPTFALKEMSAKPFLSSSK